MAISKTTGGPIVARESWLEGAFECDAFAQALLWLLDRSLKSAKGKSLDDSDERFSIEQSSWLRSLMFRRVYAEGACYQLDGKAGASTEDEYHCLVQTLLEWVRVLQESADIRRRLAAKIKPGRPSKCIANKSPNTLAALLTPVGRSKPSKRPRGRPRLAIVPDEYLLERMRATRSPGEAARSRLREIAADYLRTMGKHTAGKQLDSVARSLERQYSALTKNR